MAHDPIPAASLILVRDAPKGPPECLIVERAAHLAFAPGASVFPGGRIDSADRDLATRIGGAATPEKIAAIRETIEECALCAGISPVPDQDRLIDWQARLLAGMSLSDIVEGTPFQVDAEALLPFARWIPGPEISRRFDTSFFLAPVMDGGGLPHIGSDECISANWITATDALGKDAQGKARLIYPTRKILERLALHSSFEEIAADAARHPIQPVTPAIAEAEGHEWVSIPDGLGYPVTRNRLDEVWRG